MKICTPHWKQCLEAVDLRGLTPFVARSVDEALEKLAREHEGANRASTFDPMLSYNDIFSSSAIHQGGQQMLKLTGPKDNDGHYCPICELASHYPEDFVAQVQIDKLADQMAFWARKQGLLPPLS